jgi:putative membrane protein
MSAAAPRRVEPRHLALLGAVVVVFLWSGLRPKDQTTWLLEVFPVILALPILGWTYHRFRLTELVYLLIALHAVVLMVGGRYTYAEVPLGFWMQEAFGFARNHYDRVGHLMQGFVPALIAREILLRRGVLRPGAWCVVLVTSVCLAISACYEFLEWWTALVSAEAAEAFLGTQGDPWDTQWDMFLAGCGALAAQGLLGRVHDRQLAAIKAG